MHVHEPIASVEKFLILCYDRVELAFLQIQNQK
jgi:hypothetical protein